jgi:flagellar biosynthesis protein FlhF
MKVKTFKAPTMKLALEEIKKELGPDAFILSGKEVKPRKVLGVFGKSHFEVVAAVDFSSPKPPSEADAAPFDLTDGRVSIRISDAAVKKRGVPPAVLAPVELSPASTVSDNPETQLMLQEIRVLKSMIQAMPAGPDRLPPVHSQKLRQFAHSDDEQVYLDLLCRGFDEKSAYEWVCQAGGKVSHKTTLGKTSLKKKIAGSLNRRVKISKDLIKRRPSHGPQIIAFIGPTGVGKTTTLAKLAARAVLEDVLSVGLITLDTFRIAAIEQLKTYAEIIGVPARVVESTRQMDEAIREFESKDLILIDTAGRSQREIDTEHELANYFNQAHHIEKTLVLSATTKDADLAALLVKYKVFGPGSIIVTKLDETQIYGQIICNILRSGVPIAYVTVGQNVPRDILRPSPSKMVNLALGTHPGSWEDFIEPAINFAAITTSGKRDSVDARTGAR